MLVIFLLKSYKFFEYEENAEISSSISILMISIIFDFHVHSFRKIVFVHLTQQSNMSRIHYTWHTKGAQKYLLNADKYYGIPAEHSENLSDVNKPEKLMEKTVLKKGRNSG